MLFFQWGGTRAEKPGKLLVPAAGGAATSGVLKPVASDAAPAPSCQPGEAVPPNSSPFSIELRAGR
jgi:hypothetical protein